MMLAASPNSDSCGLEAVVAASSAGEQEKGISAALRFAQDRSPLADDRLLTNYYHYLCENLSFPFCVHYPAPRSPVEDILYRCTVLELLDPSQCVGDEIDGIFSRVWKAGFEVNLPLLELEVPQDSPNSQLIADYRRWFWNWRCR
jgi:hypothetical protein